MQFNLTALIIAALATYYTARTIAQEHGPFGIFDRLRQRYNAGYLGEGLRCIVCVSAYTALLWAVVLALLDLIAWPALPLVWLGLAGAATKIAEWWKR